MKKLFFLSLQPVPSPGLFHWAMLLVRVAASLEIAFVHGWKKIGIGVPEAENIPNPLHFPEQFNSAFAIAANIFFPLLVLLGLFTLTGYFVVHLNDPLLVKDGPFMYSLVFMIILLLGPGKYSIDSLLHKKMSL